MQFKDLMIKKQLTSWEIIITSNLILISGGRFFIPLAKPFKFFKAFLLLPLLFLNLLLKKMISRKYYIYSKIQRDTFFIN